MERLKGGAYYNEIDKFTAAWLRELIKAGLIADGEIDERDIREVEAADLCGFTQCHFFAGIGVWSYALKQAGWPDDLAMWTGSCPCQSFSASGKRRGFGDPRHLWPAWFRLISECRPHTIFGEQVASKDGLAWLDIVSSDLEGAGYAIGAADLCAAGFGAPHIRQRLYFVADRNGGRCLGRQSRESIRLQRTSERGQIGGLADAERAGQRGRRPGEAGDESRTVERSERLCATSGMVIPPRHGRREGRAESSGQQGRLDAPESGEPGNRKSEIANHKSTSGFWADAEWLWCRDGKYRPVEPGTFPLAHGIAARVGRLRGYGNALCAPVAESFIRAYLEVQARGRNENDGTASGFT